MSTIAKLFTLTALLLACTDCSVFRRRGDSTASTASQTTIRIDNRSFNDMTVYVLRNSQRMRLGSVPGLTARVLVIPSTMIFGPTPLRFIASPLAGNQREVSEEITVSPGDQVEMVIQS